LKVENPPGELIVVGSFRSSLAAQLALGRLGDEGIEAFATGDLAAATFAGVGAISVQLQVRAADADQAREILAELESPLDEDWENEAESKTWLCSLCGEACALDEVLCPSCQTPRDAIRPKEPPARVLQSTPTTPLEERIESRGDIMKGLPVPLEQDLAEEGSELGELGSLLADDLARRALRAAIIGCILPMTLVFTLYSSWLSFRLCLMPGDLSPKNSSRLRWTVFLNVAVLMTLVLIYTIWGIFFDFDV
jgi:hypothetical protein